MEDLVLSFVAASNLVSAAVGLGLPHKLALSAVFSTIANLFIGGLIISTAIVHLLAEGVESDGEFPWGFALCGAGYLIMASIEVAADGSERTSPEDMYCELRSANEEPPVDGFQRVDSLSSPEYARRRHVHHTPDAGALATTLALAVHSAGDGMAISVQPTSHRVLVIGFAIVAHKFFAAYALGTILAHRPTRERRRNLFYATLFVLSTPVTIVVAHLVVFDTLKRGAPVHRASALCSGSLLYVGIHEILGAYLDSPLLSTPAKLLSIWAGFLLMTLLAIWV
ncbi:hypothetical protein CTAYLR_001910 [Chrysophaeum taylorii]|uniref:Zinc/iron permease n=1 Tax=Chrysophaeum taylorii TaxID=2483200 RepID=A0AAD7U8W1_9STRA|nr:hypothetical protein CTAYLR_001910 [Chrysophaeum taylorii]